MLKLSGKPKSNRQRATRATATLAPLGDTENAIHAHRLPLREMVMLEISRALTRLCRKALARRRNTFACLPLLGVLGVGCTACGPFVETFVVHGKVVASETGVGLDGVPIDVRPMSDGEFIGFTTGPVPGHLLPPETENDGSFELIISNGERFRSARCPAPRPGTLESLLPDQIRVGVSHDGCQSQVLIDLNEDTVVDLSFPDNVIELKDPILVPPCDL